MTEEKEIAFYFKGILDRDLSNEIQPNWAEAAQKGTSFEERNAYAKGFYKAKELYQEYFDNLHDRAFLALREAFQKLEQRKETTNSHEELITS